ncbi:hypothetical protein B0H63DRAFT_554884 [Podospora didyma]|uniref:Zonadhesin n=1 Tax=Podospora didyma TaxID=330526 RepID=A0AAE0P4X2_9PEZI|nr:hypothetical protein B0H63DRAFT_554884 [Podospora didyma]
MQQQPGHLNPHDYRTRAYEYSLQASEDNDEGQDEIARGEAKPPVGYGPQTGRRKPDYKPTPLRWPFITVVVILLLAAIGLIVYADRAMPDSDTDAVFAGDNPVVRRRNLPRRSVSFNESTTTAPTPSSSSLDVSSSIILSTGSDDSLTVLVEPSASTTGSLESQTSSVGSLSSSPTLLLTSSTIPSASRSSRSITGAASSSGSLSTAPVTEPGDVNRHAVVTNSSSTATGSSTATLPSGARLIPISSFVSSFTSYSTADESTINVTSTGTRVVTSSVTRSTTSFTTITSTVMSVFPTTFASFVSQSGTMVGSAVATGMTSAVVIQTTTLGSVILAPGQTTFTETFTSTSQSTVPETVIPVVGSVTITYYQTVFPSPGAIENPPQTRPQEQVNPVQVTHIDVVGGTTIAVVQTLPPAVIAVPTNQVVPSVFTPPAEIAITQIGGQVVTSILVVTPSPGVSVNMVTNVGGTPVTVVNTPDPVTRETIIGGIIRTVVETPPPQTVVSMEGGTPTTIGVIVAPDVPGQPVTYTVVSNAGGTHVTQVVVTTPAGPPFQPITYTAVKIVDGTPITEVLVNTPTGSPAQPFTFTVVNTIGGTPVTQVLVTTPTGAPFKPVSFTITTNIGGTPTVVTITPSPTSFVTTINGTPVTTVATPPVTSFTTTVGGTLTTQTLITTPTGTEPITLTFVSTSGGTLSTLTRTFAPTTFLTTISGKLTTITSTPSLTTSFSTQSASTRTLTSISMSTATFTPTASNNLPVESIIVKTKVYKWTEADIFLGTFLPPLLGVALVIPLRIIDLNAKLYQPFQSLAKDGGASGAETMMMKYTGLMAFVTPVITMMQGHPVPFITTLMVGFASFMVPLATEAIGLKLHGTCYWNTASLTKCGPALGISPGPARALIALIAAVIIMLLLVLFFMQKWASGVNANPWNIAGMASLAGNTQIRIRQNTEGAMRRAISQKQYGLGYFTNALGREEYGIVLTDESGRGLQDNMEGDSESEIFDANGEAKGHGARGSGKYLPFMPLRYPWRITLIVFQLAVLAFIIYYYVYYRSVAERRGNVVDGGQLWGLIKTSTFGVRFVSAVIGVIIAFCWQSFFLSVSFMVPYQMMAQRTRLPANSILFSPSTNAFSGIWVAIKQRHLFLFVVSVSSILSEFFPVLLSNVPFSLTQTNTAATVCDILSAVFLTFLTGVLVASFFVRWPPMPVDPRCIAGSMFYVSQSHMLNDMDGVSQLNRKERDRRVQEIGRRYYYGVLIGGSWRRLGVDCDLGPSDSVVTAYRGARIDEPPAIREPDEQNLLGRGGREGEVEEEVVSPETYTYRGNRIDEPPAIWEADERSLIGRDR